MFNPTLISLLGCSVSISVSEPWDFQSSVGANVLGGVVERISPMGAESPWILCRVDPFARASKEIRYVVAVDRYKHAKQHAALALGRSVPMNFLFDGEGLLERGSDVARWLAKGDFQFLIGSIERKSWLPDVLAWLR